jgi:hypothetical protein
MCFDIVITSLLRELTDMVVELRLTVFSLNNFADFTIYMYSTIADFPGARSRFGVLHKLLQNDESSQIPVITQKFWKISNCRIITKAQNFLLITV